MIPPFVKQFLWIPAALAAASLAVPVVAQTMNLPRWDVPDAPARLVAAPSRGAKSYLVFHVTPDQMELADGRYDAFNAAGQALGVAVHPSLQGGQEVVVAARRNDHTAEIMLYLGGTVRSRPPPPPADPAPVMTTTRRVMSQAMPRDWNGIQYMISRSRVEPAVGAPAAEFNDRSGEARGPSIREHLTYLAIPEAGSYRFALAGAERAFLRLNGVFLGAYAWDGDPRSWSETPAVDLAPGLHELHVVTVRSPAASRLHLGWFRPGQPLQSLDGSVLVAGSRILHPRVERKDRLVHPDFQVQVQAAYQFRGSEALFGQWALESTSAVWAGGPAQMAWTVAGRHALAGARASAFLPVVQPAEVTLSVTDRLGFSGKLVRPVHLEPGLVQKFAVDVWWLDLPAQAYPDDVAQPSVLIQGEMTRPLGFTLDFVYRRAGEVVEQGSHELNLGREQRVVHLPELRLGHADRIEWTLRHLGVAIREGAARIERARTWTGPLQARGSGWVDEAGHKLVLLAEPWPGPDPDPAAVPSEVRWLDEILAAGAFDPGQARQVLAGPSRSEGGSAAPYDVVFAGSAPSNGALARLHLLGAVVRQADSEASRRLVLSLGLAWILEHTPGPQIERDAAVLTDLLHARGHRHLIWVAPPRFPGWEAESREVMQAVKRVARARGLPVADLYMPTATDPAAAHWFERGNPALAPHGLTRSAREVRRIAEAPHGG